MNTRTTSWAVNSHPLFESGARTGRQGLGLDMDTFPRMEVYDYGDPSFYFDTGLQQTGWAHIAIVYDGTRMHAYVNGVDKGNTAMGPLSTTSTPFIVGGDGDRSFDGVIDEVRVWMVARTAAESSAR